MGKKVIKHPFATRYYTDLNARDDAYVSHGAAKTEDGAKKATVVRIILDQFVKAQIFDRRDGTVIYTFRRTQVGITIHLGRAGEAHTHYNMRRVK